MTLPTTAGGWGTIVADPPWRFSDVVRRAVPYPTMSDEEIIRLPVRFVRAPRSHLYLWTTDSHLEVALRAARVWGFEFKHPIVWVKRRAEMLADALLRLVRKIASGSVRIRDLFPLQIGAGHYYRKAHELCLFCSSGSLVTRAHALPTVLEAPRTEHSAKPEILQTWAEEMSPGPHLEMFARRERPGWTCWGNESPVDRALDRAFGDLE